MRKYLFLVSLLTLSLHLQACGDSESETKAASPFAKSGAVDGMGWSDANVKKGDALKYNEANGTFEDGEGHVAGVRSCPEGTEQSATDAGLDGDPETSEDNRSWGWAVDVRGKGYSCAIM